MFEPQEIVFLDVEASGLGEGSFPIEVGWAWLTGPSGSLLIRPALHWDLNAWDEGSAEIHGITIPVLLADGLQARDVAERLNLLLAPATRPLIVLSDAVEMDRYWLDVLFDETPQTREFDLRDERRIRLTQFGGLDPEIIDPPIHRAEADARGLARLWRSLLSQRR